VLQPTALQGNLDPAGADVATVQNIMGLIFVVCIFLGVHGVLMPCLLNAPATEQEGYN
jgi:hypothetical protein